MGNRISLLLTLFSTAAAIGSAFFAWDQASSAKTALQIANRNNAAERVLEASVAICAIPAGEFSFGKVRGSTPEEYVYPLQPGVSRMSAATKLEIDNAAIKLTVSRAVLSLWIASERQAEWMKLQNEIEEKITAPIQNAARLQGDPTQALIRARIDCGLALSRVASWLTGVPLSVLPPYPESYVLVGVSAEDYNTLRGSTDPERLKAR